MLLNSNIAEDFINYIKDDNYSNFLYLKGKSNYEEAILNCEKAIKNSPNYYPVYNTMGLIYKGLNKRSSLC